MQPEIKQLGGYTLRVATLGNCPVCGKRIEEGGNPFICRECSNKQKGKLTMTDTQLTLAIKEAPNYTDPDAFISDMLLSTAFVDPDDAAAQPDLTQVDALRRVWTVVAAPFRDFMALTGYAQKQLSRRFNIPFSTVNGWARNERHCPTYIRLMIAELCGEI